jgi:ribonuclease HII
VILGIDEAGRGPVIGPLVICGVWLRPAGERAVRELGVRDSKAFGSSAAARAERARLADEIRQVAAHVTLLSTDAQEVDRRVRRGELNLMERELARAIIDSGPPVKRIVADGRRLFGPLAQHYPTLVAEDRADANHLVVAAASILAKVERDARFEALIAPAARKLGQAVRGGGYVNRGTETFLRAYVARFGDLPDGVRRSWSWSVLEEMGFGDQLPLLPAREAGDGTRRQA